MRSWLGNEQWRQAGGLAVRRGLFTCVFVLGWAGASGCQGGQTGQPASGLPCEELWYTTGAGDSSVAQIKELEGAYDVPLYWLERNLELPVAPSEAESSASTTLHFELEYVGGSILTRPQCAPAPLLPVRVRLATDDGRIEGEFVALTWGGARLDPVGSVELVEQIPAEALDTSGIDSVFAAAGAPSVEPPIVYVEVESASVLELPTFDVFLAQTGAGKDCGNTPGNFIGVGAEYHTTGELCLPGETGLAVWPDPCGGTATRPLTGTLETLLRAGRLKAIGFFPDLMQLEVAGVEDSVCVDSWGDALTQAEVTLTLGTESRSEVGTFRFNPGTVESPAPASSVYFDAEYSENFCWEFEASVLTPFAEALIAHDGCTELGLEDLVDQGLADGQVCLETAIVTESDGVVGSVESTFTFRSEDGQSVECGIGEGFR